MHVIDVHLPHLQQLCDAVMSIWTKIFEEVSQKGDRPFTGTVDLIKCPLSVYFVSMVADRGKLLCKSKRKWPSAANTGMM